MLAPSNRFAFGIIGCLTLLTREGSSSPALIGALVRPMPGKRSRVAVRAALLLANNAGGLTWAAIAGSKRPAGYRILQPHAIQAQMTVVRTNPASHPACTLAQNLAKAANFARTAVHRGGFKGEPTRQGK